MSLVDPGQLGTHFDLRRSVVTCTQGAATQLVGADPQRVAILFGSPSSGPTIAVWPGPDIDGNTGLEFPATGYMEFVFSRHGPLPGAEWWAWSTGVGLRVSVVEVLLRRP